MSGPGFVELIDGVGITILRDLYKIYYGKYYSLNISSGILIKNKKNIRQLVSSVELNTTF